MARTADALQRALRISRAWFVNRTWWRSRTPNTIRASERNRTKSASEVQP